MPKCDLIILEELDFLISKKSTGNADNLAKRLKISKRSVFNYLNILRGMGAQIAYSRTHNSYVYIQTGRISFCNYRYHD